jgi:hypothetical protein
MGQEGLLPRFEESSLILSNTSLVDRLLMIDNCY